MCACVCKFVLDLLFFCFLGGKGVYQGEQTATIIPTRTFITTTTIMIEKTIMSRPFPCITVEAPPHHQLRREWCTERHCTYASPARVVACSDSDPRASPVCCASVYRFSHIAQRPTCSQITIPHNHGNGTHAHGDGSPFVFNKGGITPRVRKQRTDRNAFVHESQSGR